ncbi:MAG: hypothetical protein RIQ33_525 [Bacteroidota bacterium]
MRILLFFIFIAMASTSKAQFATDIITGAEQTEEYLPLLKNKKVALVVNPTSLISNTHLVDSLLKLSINITKVFAPEHGYKGTADAGEHLINDRDKKSNLEIISLYGHHKKPTTDDLQNVDIIVFDIQDVGVRFYTYISTLHYVMQAAAENNKTVLILDRPNPNGNYIDGPILQKKYTSFVGMHPVPVVHGLTIAEYAKMINGENWLSDKPEKIVRCKLEVVTCKNYNHNKFYKLPIKPSPNLPNMISVYLYPSVCFFEGTNISLGRGTDKPFQQFGHPSFTNFQYSFTPQSMEGAKSPPCINQKCFGMDLSNLLEDSLQKSAFINIDYVLKAYKNYPDKAHFFTPFFSSLAGTNQFQQQIEDGLTSAQIKKSWQAGLKKYKATQAKYRLYQ